MIGDAHAHSSVTDARHAEQNAGIMIGLSNSTFYAFHVDQSGSKFGNRQKRNRFPGSYFSMLDLSRCSFRNFLGETRGNSVLTSDESVIHSLCAILRDFIGQRYGLDRKTGHERRKRAEGRCVLNCNERRRERKGLQESCFSLASSSQW